ncbi:MAG: ATP-dependent helicase [Marinifilaceae bacterium]
MSLRKLQQQLRDQRNTNHTFDPISAFESDGKALQNTTIPKERFEEPARNYSEELKNVELQHPELFKALSKLNPYQLQAVFSDDRKVLLSAMVGSGKTTVLTHKVLYLHFIKGIPLSQMAVLTFTNKAAREIRERIFSFYGDRIIPDSREMRYFGTFHSVARQLLKEHSGLEQLGFTSSFSIMDKGDKEDFLQRLILQNQLNVKYRNKLDQRWKLYRNEKQILYGNMKNPDDLPQLVQISRKEKQSNNLMDFDDLISIANWLMGKQANLQPQWVIIDEFQDCNEEQLRFIQYLNGENSSLFAVGDPNQSIYAWRGSTDKVFQIYSEDPNCKMMRLPLNYRTSGQLLDAAACLLREQQNDLQATRDQGRKLRIVNHFDDNQEAYYCVETFKQLHKSGTPWKEIALLFRTRQQIELFKTIFLKEELPFEVVSKESFRDRPSLFWLHKLLHAALHPNDLDSILYVFTSPDFGFLKSGKTLLNKFIKFYDEQDFNSKLEAFSVFLEKKYAKQKDYIQLSQGLLQLPKYLQEKNTKDLPCIYTYLNLELYLKPTSVNFQQTSEEIKESLKELQQFAEKNYYGNMIEIYQAALSQVSLEGHFQINGGIKEKGEGVRLLTIHAAKGLEFDYVFLSGANTGLIPLSRKNEGPDHLQEEKRLLFVALTRARNHMEISWHTQSNAWNAQPGPSYFLNAIPSHLVERIQTDAIQEEPEQKTEEQSIPNTTWQIDIKVKHPKYGEGVILKSNAKEIVCEFGKFGEKSFSPQWAPLTKI